MKAKENVSKKLLARPIQCYNGFQLLFEDFQNCWSFCKHNTKKKVWERGETRQTTTHRGGPYLFTNDTRQEDERLSWARDESFFAIMKQFVWITYMNGEIVLHYTNIHSEISFCRLDSLWDIHFYHFIIIMVALFLFFATVLALRLRLFPSILI